MDIFSFFNYRKHLFEHLSNLIVHNATVLDKFPSRFLMDRDFVLSKRWSNVKTTTGCCFCLRTFNLLGFWADN